MIEYYNFYFKNLNVHFNVDDNELSALKIFSPKELNIRENEDGRKTCFFRTTAKEARRRLEILGYNEQFTRDSINDHLRLFDFKNFVSDKKDTYLYKTMDYEKIQSAYKEIFNIDHIKYEEIQSKFDTEGLKNFAQKYQNASKIVNSVIEDIILSNGIPSYIDTKPEYDIDLFKSLYLIISCMEEDYEVELYGNLCYGEKGFHYQFDEETVKKYFEDTEKITIITEGKTDYNILKKSLELLYPNYRHMFSFFDFYESNAEGSAGNLVKLIKAFIAGGFKNKIIAIFDNDTAAMESLINLDAINVPNNIIIFHLPELEFCRSYPTYGPSGIVNMNINGHAVSIEMFFGDDIIKEKEKYVPIQWTGYSKRLNQYQGSIIDKNLLIEKMYEKLNINYDPLLDWIPLKKLWINIFTISSNLFNRN